MRGLGRQRALERDPLDLPDARAQDLVRAVRDPARRLRVRGPAVRRVVLEAAVARGVVRRRHDDPVRELGARGADPGLGGRAVVQQDRLGHGRGRGVGVARVDVRLDTRGRQDLDRGLPRGQRQRVRVTADEERAVGALGAPVLDDRRGDRDDVRLVERVVQARPAVARRPEHHLLRRVVDVGREVVVGADHGVHVDEVLGLGEGSGAGVHATILPLVRASREVCPGRGDRRGARPRSDDVSSET
ncbi:hypothetical protein D3C74_341100 [compost metagenome]